MITQDTEILVQLERLAQAFPWGEVTIWINRAPEGQIRFQAYVPGDYGVVESLCESGDSVIEAVDRAARRSHERDPEAMRRKAIEDLKEKLAKMQEKVFGLPPYVPNRELCERNPVLQHTIKYSPTVDV